MKTSGAGVDRGSRRFLRYVPVLLLAAVVATATLGDLQPQVRLCEGVCSGDLSKTCVTTTDCGSGGSCVFTGTCSTNGEITCSTDADCNNVGGTCEFACDAADERYQGAVGDFFGFDVAVGDVCSETGSGDPSRGFDDVIVGSPEENRVYIFCGSLKSRLDQDEPIRNLPALNQADIVIFPGSEREEFGFSVATVRAGTGPSPLLIGAPATDTDATPVAFLVPAGALDGLSGQLNIEGTGFDSIELTGASLDQSGYALAASRTTEGTCSLDAGKTCVTSSDCGDDGFCVPTGACSVATTQSCVTDSDCPGNGEACDLDILYAVSARNASSGRGSVYYFERSDLPASPVNLPDLPQVSGTRADTGNAGDPGGEGLGESLVFGEFWAGGMGLAIGAVGLPQNTEPGRTYVIDALAAPPADLSAGSVCIEGKAVADFFGYTLASGRFVATPDQLAVGSIYAVREDGDTDLSNAGAVYVFQDLPAPAAWTECSSLDPDATTTIQATHTIEGGAAFDQLGTAMASGNVGSPAGYDDLLMTARWSDRTANFEDMTLDNVDEGATYVIFGGKTFGEWPATTACPLKTQDCSASTGCLPDCSVGLPPNVDLMLMGGSFGSGKSDEIGFSVDSGDYNLDGAGDIAVSSLTHNRVYLVSPMNTNSQDTGGGSLVDPLRNVRDEDDDGDGYADTLEDCNQDGVVDMGESDPLTPSTDAGITIGYTVVEPRPGTPDGVVSCDPVSGGQIQVEIVVANQSAQIAIEDPQAMMGVTLQNRIYGFTDGSLEYEICRAATGQCTDPPVQVAGDFASVFPRSILEDGQPLEVGDSVRYRFRMFVLDEPGTTYALETVTANVFGIPNELSEGDGCPPAQLLFVHPNEADDDIPLACPDLTITKESPADVNSGESFEYSIEVRNNGSDVADNVVVLDVFPNEFNFVGAVGCDSVSTTPAGIECELGPVNASQTRLITFDVEVPSTQGEQQDVLNSVTVSTSNVELDSTNNDASVTTDIIKTAILELTKTDGLGVGEVVVAGQPAPLVYTITIDNLGPSEAENVQVLDTLPPGVTLISTTGCMEDGSGGGYPICTLNPGNIGAGGSDSYVLTVSVDSDALGPITNRATASSDTTPDDPEAEVTTQVVDRADLELTMTDNVVDPVIAGQDNITYTLTVENLGPSLSRNVRVGDVLPAGVEFVSSTGCTNDPNGEPNCSLGDIGAGSQVSYDITVRTLSSALGDITLVANTTSDTIDPNPANDVSTQITTIEAKADLSVAKVDNVVGQIIAGRDGISYSVTVTNNGPSDAVNVIADDSLPPGVTFLDTLGCVNDPNGVPACSLGTIAAGADATYTIQVSVDPSTLGNIENTVLVSSDTPDDVPGNDLATAITFVEASADLGIAKANLTGPVTAGDPLTYEITVTNNGPSDSLNVQVTDTLPADVTFVSTTNCPAGVGANCDLGTVAAGNSAVYTILVTVNPGTVGTVTNQASVAADTLDENPANDIASVDTPIGADADLRVAISDSPDPVVAGETLLYTVQVDNDGPSDAVVVVVDATLDPDLTFVQTVGCTNDPNGAPSCALGNIAAMGSASFTIEATVNQNPAATISTGVQVSSDTNDSNPGNNSDTEDTTVGQAANLKVTKDDGDGSGDDLVVAPGGTIVYTNLVENIGSSDAMNVRVTDALPAGVTFVSTSGCNEDPGAVPICTLGDIAAGASASYTITVTVDLATLGVITNTATALSDTPEADPSDNTDSEDTAVCDCAFLDDDCNQGVCDPATALCSAQPINEGGACDDGDDCNDGETCTAGACIGGAPQDCTAFDDQCNVGVCNPGTGACEAQPANEGGPCDDGIPGNEPDTCTAGVCSGLPPIDPPVSGGPTRDGIDRRGDGSTDVDLGGVGTVDPDIYLLGTRWTVVSKPTGSRAIMWGSGSPAANFTPDVPGTYEVQVVVGDSRNPAASDCQWSMLSKPAGSRAALRQAGCDSARFDPDLSGTYVVKVVARDGAPGGEAEPARSKAGQEVSSRDGQGRRGSAEISRPRQR